MWTVDPSTLALLLSGDSLPVDAQVTCITPTAVVTVPVLEQQSSVSSSFGQSTGKTATLTVPRDFTDAGYLNPLTDRVVVALQLPGVPDVPLFAGRVLQPVEQDTGLVTVTCVDVGDDIINDDFPNPWVANPAQTQVSGAFTVNVPVNTIGQEIIKLVHDVDPGIFVDISQMPVQPVPQLSWDTSRGQALGDLTDQVNCVWQGDRLGGVVAYVSPYALTTPPTPVVTLQDGVNGTVVSLRKTVNRSVVFNSFTVVSERADASGQAIRVTVFDADPLSLTRYGGPFGRRNKTVKDGQVAPDAASVTALALRKLRQTLALQETYDVTTPCMPLLDQGDVIGLTYRGQPTLQVVTNVQVGLAATTATRITTQRLVLTSLKNVGIL